MDPVIQSTVGSRRNNKENKKPANGHSKAVANHVFPKKTTVPAPLGSKNNTNGEDMSEAGNSLTKSKTKALQEDSKARPAEILDKKKRQTLTQAFLSRQAMQQKKLVSEPTKPPAAVPPKPLPVPKPPAPKPSATLPPRSKSVSHRAPAPAAKPVPATTAPAQAIPRVRLYSAPSLSVSSRVRRSPARQASRAEATAHPASSKFSASLKRKEQQQQQNSKPKALVVTTDRKAPKPPATSTLSQYRASMETAEERRTKLAEWLTSKGKTLKRPPIALAASKTISRPALKSQPNPEPTAEHRQIPETETVVKSDTFPELQPVASTKSHPEPNAKPETEPEEEPELAPSSTPNIMNTTLDLLDNSEMDLPVDPEIRMDDLVVNLCNAMEAMEVPSTCDSDLQVQGDNEGSILKENQRDTLEGTDEKGDLEDVKKGEKVKVERDGDISKKEGMKVKREDEMASDEEDVPETPPEEAEGASVVRYSVKTTPYLQSVKRTIQSEVAPGSGSRRKSAIKDLKFLTPVRRSLRIQRESSRLPGMLTDHDPCVSSLAELVKLDEDANAYIYRKNPALLGDLPDQPEELEDF
ncbi:hypothetical protein MATL_G00050310 [Megalops atlanticus]|uniref:Cytoskeleton-associated protein 2 C-terminal domain-containing protein n=1 Tax=Megalops atlanticus TaxID=7932 RepID=A0A9D3TAV9_MEGAT|nr:hypothetical protein MATL_G00050310 [Megalops atlanticus]